MLLRLLLPLVETCAAKVLNISALSTELPRIILQESIILGDALFYHIELLWWLVLVYHEMLEACELHTLDQFLAMANYLP